MFLFENIYFLGSHDIEIEDVFIIAMQIDIFIIY